MLRVGGRRFSSFAERVEDELNTIQVALETMLEDVEPEADIDMKDGVLSLSLPGRGKYVINKQTPNEQVRQNAFFFFFFF